jgi:Transposase
VEEGALVATPAQVDVWVGLDVGKSEHFADVLDNDGERLFARAVTNDQGDLEALLDQAASHGTPGLVIDQPGSISPARSPSSRWRWPPTVACRWRTCRGW